MLPCAPPPTPFLYIIFFFYFDIRRKILRCNSAVWQPGAVWRVSLEGRSIDFERSNRFGSRLLFSRRGRMCVSSLAPIIIHQSAGALCIKGSGLQDRRIKLSFLNKAFGADETPPLPPFPPTIILWRDGNSSFRSVSLVLTSTDSILTRSYSIDLRGVSAMPRSN